MWFLFKGIFTYNLIEINFCNTKEEKIAHFSCISGHSSGPFIGSTPAGAPKQAATVRAKLVTLCGMVDPTKFALLFFIW